MRCRRSTLPTGTTARRRRRALRRHAKMRGSHSDFLSVVFPHHQMTILDYNRVIRDLNGRSADQVLTELKAVHGRGHRTGRCGRTSAVSSDVSRRPAGIG
jgi:hypothetical protein